MGGTRDERYNLSFIVNNGVEADKPFIGVSIAYRLSAWGFLNSDEVSGAGQTNIGLRDQRLALHWLQENIAAFGGDPSKVTIWGKKACMSEIDTSADLLVGESAGAGSVGWHLTAYNGRDDGLFRAGIMESGNPVNYNSYQDLSYWQPKYDQIVNNVSCSDAIDTLDCLRHVPFEQLNAAINTTSAQQWAPIVDGDFIARWASIQLAEGDFVKVPIIDGANSDEGTAFGPYNVHSTADWLADALGPPNNGSTNLPPHFSDELQAAYPNDCSYYIPGPPEYACNASVAGLGDAFKRSAAYYGDLVMIANRRGACQTWAANGIDAYCYRFNIIPAGLPFVTHFQEVAFVFDNTNGYGYNALHGTINPFANKSEAYIQVAKLMSTSWASFIADLNPNNYTGRPSGTPDWAMYSVDNPQDIVWDVNVTGLAYNEPDTFRKEGIQFILDHALSYHR